MSTLSKTALRALCAESFPTHPHRFPIVRLHGDLCMTWCPKLHEDEIGVAGGREAHIELFNLPVMTDEQIEAEVLAACESDDEAEGDYSVTSVNIPLEESQEAVYTAVEDRHKAILMLLDENEALLEVARRYEAWEAALVMCNASWEIGLPIMTQGLYQDFIEIQILRNAAIAKAKGETA